MNNNLMVDVDTLGYVCNEFDKHNMVILDNLEDIYKCINELGECFNSKAGNTYYNLLDEYLKKVKKTANGCNNYLRDKLLAIKDIYGELNKNLEKGVANDIK